VIDYCFKAFINIQQKSAYQNKFQNILNLICSLSEYCMILFDC